MTINETVEDTLTNSLWQKWKQQGTQTKMTWLEIQKLACALTKMSREQNLDYQAFDFQAIVDSKLNYYENLSQIENTVYGPCQNFAEAVKEIEQQKTTEQQNKTLTLQNKKLKNEIERQKEKLGELQNNPQVKTVYVTTTPTPENKLAVYEPTEAPYTDAELTEIQEYLQKRQNQKHRNTTKETLKKTAKILWQIIY